MVGTAQGAAVQAGGGECPLSRTPHTKWSTCPCRVELWKWNRSLCGSPAASATQGCQSGGAEHCHGSREAQAPSLRALVALLQAVIKASWPTLGFFGCDGTARGGGPRYWALL